MIKVNSTEKLINKLKEIKPTIKVLGEWTGSQNKTLFYCKKCNNKFESTPNTILNSKRYGCPYCAVESRKNSEYLKKLTLTLNDVKNKISEMYPDGRYTLLEKNYKNNKYPMLMKCNNCGNEFRISYVNFCKGKGCPYHKSNRFNSKNVVLIKNILDSYGIEYETEVSFEECKFQKELSFDFLIYINKENDEYILLEYDGEYHFRPYDKSKENIQKYKNQIRNDEIKNKFCKDFNIKLERINYKEKDIELHLNKILLENNLIDKHSSTIETNNKYNSIKRE